MTVGGRIRTPWKHRWRRFRYSAMPVFCFLGCVALTLWLWRDQRKMPNAVAVVEQKSVSVAASADGKLLAPPSKLGGYWKPFDTVDEGQEIARLDDSVLQASADALKKELVRLKEELLVTAEQIRIDMVGREHERARHRLGLIVQAEKSQLDVLDRTAQIKSDKMLWQRLDATLQSSQKFAGQQYQVVSALEVKLAKMERDEVRIRIEENELARKKAQAVAAAAQQRLDDYPAADVGEAANVETLLASIRARIETQGALIDELNREIDALTIFAPFSGVICQIHCWPDQYVRRGDPIVTLATTGASTENGKLPHAVAFISQEHRIPLKPGMKVGLQSRASGNRFAIGTVVQIGPHYEPVPLRNLRNPNIPERGRALRIKLPPEFDVVPGEVLDVRLSARPKQS